MPSRISAFFLSTGAMALSAALVSAAPAQTGKPLGAKHKGAAAARTMPAAKSVGTVQVGAPALPVPRIAYTRFTLPNGLRVIHLEDKRTPTVTVQLWYGVGSKNEPLGRSGFAHLFEHLMFNGSEHFNDDWFKATQKLGATNLNGTTNTDRTNYYQTVPKGALDSILWLESDRMGYLLKAIDQAKLDEQRRVVQNEKRQRENAPMASVPDRIMAATYSPNHPYGHSVIGSMADLDAASLDDVKQWFRDWYGPNNAVLVLAGDLTLAEARTKAARYFGELPGGAPVAQPRAWVQKLGGDQRETMQDRVPSPVLIRVWNVPGLGDADGERLDAIAAALAGDRNARLNRRLIYAEGLATAVGASNGQSALAGQFSVSVTLKPGADLKRVEAILGEELARLLAEGPTAAELEKGRIRQARALVDLMDSVSGRASILAQGELYEGDPDAWRASAMRANAVTPAAAAAAARKWLSGGSYTLVVEPFPVLTAATAKADRTAMPEPGAVADPAFPRFERFRLSNGIEVWLSERHEAPKVTMQMVVQTGADPDYLARTPGTGALAVALLDEGTERRTGLEIADQLDRVGGSLGVGGGGEETVIGASALSARLDPVIDIWADVIRNPAFRAEDFAREQTRQVQGARQAQRTPEGLSGAAVARALWGPQHPYGRMATPETVAAIGRADVDAFHRRWFGPNHARIVVVGDTTSAEIRPKLEAAFADWAPAPGVPMAVPAVERPAAPLVLLIDSPGAPQSLIRAASVAAAFDPAREDSDDLFNAILGGGFTSRLNMNLREAKGWSYGVRSGVQGGIGPRAFQISAPVQTNRTRDAILELKRELREIAGDRPVGADELEIVRRERMLQLTGAWGSGSAVVGALDTLARYRLPEDYFVRASANLRSVTLDQVRAAGARLLPDDRLVWVIVGDLSKIEDEVRSLGLGEVRVLDAEGKRLR